MDQPAHISKDFERTCRQILIAQGYEDHTDTATYRNPSRVDFAGRHSQTGREIIAEMKLYLSSQVPSDRVNRAIEQLLTYRNDYPAAELLLIFSVPVKDNLKALAIRRGISDVWDLPILEKKASISSSLATQLASILAQAGVGDRGTLGPSPALMEQDFVTEPSAPYSKSGTELCESLRRIPAGKPGWVEFEKQCIEALKFLFGNHFGSWSPQDETEDGSLRRDFLVRLRPKSDFWTSLSHDFRCRYIVFEFKNFVEKISQEQIYSTEKYLFTAALRSVAILLARNGADAGAIRAAGGALRETGKLIVVLSLDDLCEMLHARDRADDPELVLHSRLDNLLTGLGR